MAIRIGVTGPHGNIGSVCVKLGMIPLECDVTKIDEIRRDIKKTSPDIIIHTASKSKPTWCSENFDKAIAVNYRGSVNLFEITEKLDIPVIALSTDHIFNGKKGQYKENDNRYKYPVNNYGHTKLAMEGAADVFDHVKVVRTSNCFWSDDPRAMWYLNALNKYRKVPVPIFQKRSFMHVEHFVDSIEYYVQNVGSMPNILHISGSKNVTWLEFMKAFAHANGKSDYMIKKFVPKWFDDKTFVKRPKKAGLSTKLSEQLGFRQYNYLDGMELIHE